jgi:hypothetical protein
MTREVLVDSLGAWVVKVVNSPLAKEYDPTGEPAVVFFRDGNPILYQGPPHTYIECNVRSMVSYVGFTSNLIYLMNVGAPNEEDLLSKIQQSQEPAVRELTDENFEHLTQASTGATTGDWLVML